MIEDSEMRLVFSWSEQIRAKPGAAADHLFELDHGSDRLCEYEIDDFRHVDSGVQHIDGHRDFRVAVRRAFKVVDQLFGPGVVVIDDPAEFTAVLREQFVEDLRQQDGMVVVAGLGLLSMLKAALLAAGLMLVSGCCSHANARRSIEWEVLLTIAAALGLGMALDKTGAANALAGGCLSLAGGHPWVALAIVYALTSVFTAAITNNATAALFFPIAMHTAEQLGVSIMPFVICTMIAASASFATPIGYQTNLMVYGPGGYRFSDYLRIGVPLNITIGAVCVALAPLIWPFSV